MSSDPSRELLRDISELGSLMGTEDMLPVWELDWSDNWPVPLEVWQYEYNDSENEEG